MEDLSADPSEVMPRRLVGVGVGPGEPDLITVKAMRSLRSADLILVPSPEHSGTGPGRAESNVAEACPDLIERLRLVPFSMADKDGVGPRREAGARTVCLATVGDPSVYSTSSYLATEVRKVVPDVVIDEVGRFAIPLVGGHDGGANELARLIADGIGATAVITTATDALRLPALDDLGWPSSGAIAAVTRAIINGDDVLLRRTQPWPLPAFPDNVRTEVGSPTAMLVVSDEEVAFDQAVPTAVVHPRSLVAGMGCNRGTSVEALRALLLETLREGGLALESLATITSIDAKEDEPGLLQLATDLGITFVTYASDVLVAQSAPTPSPTVALHMGTPSVAEASVLAHEATLLVQKRRSAEATCAIGRIPARGRLAVVGLGPGSRDLLTPRARSAITSASVVVGYAPYVDQIRDLLRPGTRVFASGMGTEQERTEVAIAHAREGQAVALVCSGDPAIYAMTSPVLEQGTEGIDVDIVPGVTASLAVSAILGAPLGHDHVTISLSDLHTDWATIERRLTAAAEGDLVAVLYNPRSRTRGRYLTRALEILSQHRPPSTPIAVVREACRPEQHVRMSTLGSFDPEWVDMNSLVVIGSSTTRYVTTGGNETRMVTPRDYRWIQA